MFGVDRSKEKKKQECLETLCRQNQLMNKELISKKRKTIYQNLGLIPSSIKKTTAAWIQNNQ